MMKSALDKLIAALGWKAVPPALAAIATQLEQSAWPEMVERWSRLTPTGFPIEITLTDADPVRRWVSEIAGPEVAEMHRLDLVAMRMDAAGQPVPGPLLEALRSVQRGCDLGYGAWLGGRAIDDGAPARFKLYAELPLNATFVELPLPPALAEICARVPVGTLPRIIGVEPTRNRFEIYTRLPPIDLDDLRPVLRAAGRAHAIDALERVLPDGKRRLAGRPLAISFATEPLAAMEVALCTSARSLFPGAPDLLRRFVPVLTGMQTTEVRLTLVTLGFTTEDYTVSRAVGVTIAPANY